MATPNTVGHLLWSLLQDGHYVGVEEGVPFDYWDELPERRRRQYEDAAHALIVLGSEQKQGLKKL